MKREVEKIQGFLRHAWDKRWWLLGIHVLAAAAALTAFHVLPPKYRSATTIRVSPDSVINPLTQGLAVSSRTEALAGTLREEVLSRKHLEDVITRLDLEQPDTDPVQHEQLIRKIARNISIDIRGGGARRDQNMIFQIAYTGRGSHEVRDVTNALAALFIEKNLELRKGESDVAYEFIREQLLVYRKKLEESENALRRFEEDHLDEMPETRATNLARLEALKSSLEEVRRDIFQAKNQKDLLIKRIPAETPVYTDGGSVLPNPLIEKVTEREETLTNLRRTYSENYPDVVVLKNEIEEMRAAIAKAPTVPASEARGRSTTPVQETIIGQLQQIDLELGSLASRVPQLEKEIRRYEGKVRGIPEREQMLAQLRRDYDVDSSIYEMFLRRLEEARVSREMELARKGDVFRIVDAAALPAIPVSPVKKMFFLYGLAGGLALSMALTYWFWANDTSLKNVRETEDYLGIGVIAMTPRLTTQRDKRRQRREGILFIGACGTAAALYFVGFYWR